MIRKTDDLNERKQIEMTVFWHWNETNTTHSTSKEAVVCEGVRNEEQDHICFSSIEGLQNYFNYYISEVVSLILPSSFSLWTIVTFLYWNIGY